eukprot:m51a1_g10230 putative imidazole glycerol phosphate synthase (818) ;mRNA; r:161003-163933
MSAQSASSRPDDDQAPRVPVVVVRTGTANTGSMLAALRRAGADAAMATDAAQVATAGHVVVPGVGTYGACLAAVRGQPGLEEALRDRVRRGAATLFVCVGLQVLGNASEETAGVAGLGAVQAECRLIPAGEGVRVPQQGWNRVEPAARSRFISPGYAFFTNSYAFLAPAGNSAEPFGDGWAASTTQHGARLVSALERGQVLAVQFHPELSGRWGRDLLRRWLGSPRAEPNVLGEQTLASLELCCGQHQARTGITTRVVPCLDVRAGRVVKGVQFCGLRDAGDPAERAAFYESQGADELVVLDVSATAEERSASLATIRAVRAVLSVPLTVGGGLRSCDDALAALEAGADKVSVNTAAVSDPGLLAELSARFGRQCVVVAIDAVRCEGPAARWEVVTHAGTRRTGRDAVEWAREAVERGAGEVLLTSWDRDGTRQGYDVELLRAVGGAVRVPVVASGGADGPETLVEAVRAGGADAVLAASMFHSGTCTVAQAKLAMAQRGVAVRPVDGLRIASPSPSLPAPGGAEQPLVRLALPKGRLQEEVLKLLAEAGIGVTLPDRGYRARISVPGWEVKLLNPRDVVSLMHAGSRDLGFSGQDLVEELDAAATLVSLVNTKLSPVRIVAAAPPHILDAERRQLAPTDRPLVIATEYERLAKRWVAAQRINAVVIRTRGATEAFPPDDADLIVDNTSSGATLAANNLHIIDELLRSETHLYAHGASMHASDERRRSIEHFVLAIQSVLNARRRVLVEFNASAEGFEELVKVLPCMKQPTISTLYGNAGFAVKIAVERSQLFSLIPRIKEHGGGDIIVSNLVSVIP